MRLDTLEISILVCAGNVMLDPMCGSGTFLIEAALMARRIAPGLMRAPTSWPFTKWPDHSPKDWATELDNAQGQIRHWRGKLIGSDMHPVRETLKFLPLPCPSGEAS